MENTLLFQQKAKVLSNYGEELGSISRFVIHPDTNVISHIVMSHKKSLFSSEEKVIPVDQVADTTGDHVTLCDTASDVDNLPAFMEKRRIRDDSAVRSGGPVSQAPLDYGMPMVAATSKDPPEGRYITIVEQNIPTGTVAVKEGAKVIASKGENVGKVEGVIADLPEDQVTHLLVSEGKVSDEMKLVPMDWVSWLEDKEVHLSVGKETVKELESESPGPIE